jgi:glucose/arabinose dehydrogenase
LSVNDFITGWISEKGASGRPVDIIFDKNGKMFISDDKAGVIYKVEHAK